MARGEHAYIGNTGPFHLEKFKESGLSMAEYEKGQGLLTVAGVGHARIVAADAGTSTSHKLRIAMCMGGRHRVIVGMGDSLDMTDRRVDEGNSNGGGCGSQECREDGGELHDE
jgi:hypothetical protein